MRTDILISFLFSTPNEIAHEVGASCNDLYFFIKQASRTLKKKKHSYRSEAQSFYEFSSKPTKIQPIKQTSASIHKIKKNKETVFTMHINSSYHAITVHEENRQTDSKYVKLREKRYWLYKNTINGLLKSISNLKLYHHFITYHSEQI